MKNTKLYPILIVYFLMIPVLSAAENRKVLIINSNASVEKYRTVQDEFKKALSVPVSEVNLENTGDEKANSLSFHAPDIVYCIGAKAYSAASRYFADKHIVFSSVLNYRRMDLTSKTYGVSYELHPRMPLYIVRSLFPTVKRIGMLYSKQFTRQWFESARDQAKELGLEIAGRAVSDSSDTEPFLKQIITESDAVWMISDPVVMPEEKYLNIMLKICDEHKKPVLSYNDMFVELGASLVVSADDPTIGRQAAGVVSELLSGAKPEDKVQFPAGSQIILNLKKIREYNLEYNQNALGTVNTIIQ